MYIRLVAGSMIAVWANLAGGKVSLGVKSVQVYVEKLKDQTSVNEPDKFRPP